MSRWTFYKDQINKWLDKNSSVLILGASNDEAKLFLNFGFKKICLGYFDDRQKKNFLNLGFKDNDNLFKIDIRKIPFKENSFDYTFTHATIHHVDLPHLAISELFRVSKNGCLIIESNDSLIMRLSSYFGFSEEFELSSIENNCGGLLNTGTPNYIYRWNEREISKLIKSYKPDFIYNISYNYYYDHTNNALEKNLFKKTLKKIIAKVLNAYLFIFRKQKNVMSIFIDKKNKVSRFQS